MVLSSQFKKVHWPIIAALSKNIMGYNECCENINPFLNKVKGRFHFGLLLSHTQDSFDII